MIPYWIAETLRGLPVYLLVYLGVGIPWVLAVLPRADRCDWATVLPVGFIFGAAGITAWMFVLGTVGGASKQPLFTPGSIAVGGAALAVIGAGIVLWRGRQPRPAGGDEESAPSGRLALDERLLILLIVVAALVAFLVIAYWPFTAYDSLWVYGYEARLYAMTGYIPSTIGYYPQFLPLQYTMAQLGSLSDHSARAVVLLLYSGTILAVYVLGKLTAGRRAGIFAAAFWALYPHVGEWSRAGDLEVPLAFSFTLASAFFLRAWTSPPGSKTIRRDAALAGFMFGVAMWTKPTAAAFALGVVLMLLVDGARVFLAGEGEARRLSAVWRGIRPRLEIALIAALACLPLGAVWYVRNLALGHPAVDFPPGYWQTLAERGGDEFGFPLLAALVGTGYLLVRFRESRRVSVGIGVALMLAAVARSILIPDLSLEARRMTLIEIAVLVLGAAVLYRTLVLGFLRASPRGRDLLPLAARLGWAQVLALPYFVVWFYAYSYHYRLSFAIVPLMLLPTAVILARWIPPVWTARTRFRPVYLLALVVLAVPGIYSPVPDKFAGANYLFTEALPDDDARYRSGNAALMNVVDGLRVWKDEHPNDILRVAAPGVDRLPFFFPTDDIRIDRPPTRLDEIEDAAYLVYGLPETRGAYESVPFFANQVLGALGRQDIMHRAWGLDDGIFKYDIYELQVRDRWTRPEPQGAAQQEVIFGGFARYLGYDIGGLELWTGRRVYTHLYFEVLAPPPDDYSIYVHLRDTDGNLIASWDNPTARTDMGYYSTLMWQPGEYISDERIIELPDDVAPLGEGYRLVIGFYDSANVRVPVTVDGAPGSDGYQIDSRIAIVPPRS